MPYRNPQTIWSRFSPEAILLFVLALCLCLCLSLLAAYGLDIVIPQTFLLGTCLGILFSRLYDRPDLLGGSLGGAVGGALGGFVVGFYASTRGDVGGMLWALMMSVSLFLPGLGGGLILACVVVVASRCWRASKPSRRRILATVAVLAVIAGTVLIPWPYRDQAYSGDGSIEDTGFWTYPRYHVRFSQMSLMEPGEHVFRCWGLPHAPLTFRLQIVGEGDYDVLRSLTTRVDVRLTSAEGHTLGQASGRLSDWKLTWTPANRTGGYYHPDFTRIKVPRRSRCTLTITVADIDPKTRRLAVRPMLRGGGNELP